MNFIIKTTIFLVFLISSEVFSQNSLNDNPFTQSFDINNQPIELLHNINYHSENVLNVIHTPLEGFLPGYYYDMGKNKISGWLKQPEYEELMKYNKLNSFFHFRKEEYGSDIIITPEKCSAFIIGQDSFSVIQNFEVNDEYYSSNEFAQVIGKSHLYTYYKHEKFASLFLNSQMFWNSQMITSYVVKVDSSNKFFTIGKDKLNLKDNSLLFLGENEFLRNFINKKNYKYEDIPLLIKYINLKRKFEQNKRQYYNSSWDEINVPQEAGFYSVIKGIQDSTIYLSFYINNGTPIYDGHFTMFYQTIKDGDLTLTKFYQTIRNGDFKWYYPDGTLRKQTTFYNNVPSHFLTFYRDGKKYYDYINGGEFNYFYNAFRNNGESIFDTKGNGADVVYDSTFKINIVYEFINKRITLAYYIDTTGKKTYLLCDKNALLKGVNSLQRKINNTISYPSKAVENKIDGQVLIKCIVEPSGLVSDIRIIKGIDSECDKIIMDLLSIMKYEKYWTPGLIGKEKITQESIIAVNFTIQDYIIMKNDNTNDNTNHITHPNYTPPHEFNLPQPPKF